VRQETDFAEKWRLRAAWYPSGERPRRGGYLLGPHFDTCQIVLGSVHDDESNELDSEKKVE
jgi:hypothetical protein